MNHIQNPQIFQSALRVKGHCQHQDRLHHYHPLIRTLENQRFRLHSNKVYRKWQYRSDELVNDIILQGYRQGRFRDAQ